MNILNLSPKALSKNIHTVAVMLTEKNLEYLKKLSNNNVDKYTPQIVNAAEWLYVRELDYEELLDSNDSKIHKITIDLTPHQIQELWNIQQAWYQKHYSISSIINTAIKLYNERQ